MAGTARDREHWNELLVAGYQPSAQDFADLVQSFLLADASDFPDPLPEVFTQHLRDIAADELSGGISAETQAALDAKADKVPDAIAGNLAAFTADGNLVDSGAAPADGLILRFTQGAPA